MAKTNATNSVTAHDTVVEMTLMAEAKTLPAPPLSTQSDSVWKSSS